MGKHLLITIAILVNGVCVVGQNLTPTTNFDSTKISLTGPSMRQSTPLFIVNAGDRTLKIPPAMKDHDSFSMDLMNDIKEMNDIKPTWIQAITVFRDQQATDMYGALGKYGVVVIELKDNVFEKMPAHLAEKFKIR